MKKLISMLLCAAILLSLPVGVFAAPPGRSAPEPAAQAAGAAETAPDAPARTDETQKEPPQAYFNRTHPILDRASGEADGLSLQAASGRVTVTVQFPAGVTAPAGGEVYVALLKTAEIDRQGMVTREPELCYGDNITLNKGAASFSFTAEGLEAGSYFCQVHPYFSDTAVPNDDLFFNADGSLADNKYTVTGFALASGGSTNKTVQIPRAAASVSGELTFSSPMAQATTLYIYAYCEDTGVSGQLHSEIDIPKGASRTSFAIASMDRAAFCLEFDINDYLYYCVDNTLSNDWNLRNFFDLSDGSVSGLSVNGDELLKGGGTTAANVNVAMSVTLPEAQSHAGEYVLAAFRAGSPWVDRALWVSAKDGARTVSTPANVPLRIRANTDYVFGYVDGTQSDSWSSGDCPGMRYIAEDGGVTSDISQAKIFSFTENGSVSLTEPPCWKITGTVSRGDYCLNRSVAALVTADFSDNQSWGTRAVFPAGSDSASYTIYVPKTQGGTYTLHAAYANHFTNLNPDNNSRTDLETVFPALSGNTTAAPITMKDYSTVSGTVSLPKGVTAPTGGLAVSVSLWRWSDPDACVVIPAGANSAPFSFPSFETGVVSLTAAPLNKASGFLGGETEVTLTGGDVSGIDLNLRKLAAISGTISLPRGVDSAGVALSISADSAGGWFAAYRSIREGAGASAAYTLYVPDGEELTDFGLYITYTSNLRVDYSPLYVGSDWSVSDKPWTVQVSGDRSGVDFTLNSAVLLTGALFAEDGAALTVDTNQSCWLYYVNSAAGIYDSTRIAIDANGGWTAAIPKDAAGDLIVSLYIDGSAESNLLSGEYYYTTGTSAVTDSDNASILTVPAGGLDNIRIPVRTGCRITGEVKLPDGASVTMKDGYTSFSLDVSAEAQEQGISYSGSCNVVAGITSYPYSIIVPKEKNTYTISCSGNPWYLDYCTTNVIFDESVTAAQTVSVNGQSPVQGPDFTLSLAKAAVTGTVARPAGVQGTLDLNVSVRTEKEGRYSGYVSIPSGSAGGSYSILIPSSDDSAWYTVDYDLDYGPSSLAARGYLTADGVSTSPGDAAQFSFSGSTDHSFTPATRPPFLQGKVYVPAAVREDFSLTVSTNYGAEWIDVTPSRLPSDSTGRYVEYAIYSDIISEGDTYSFYVQADDESGVLDTSDFYVDASGALTKDYSRRKSFTYTAGASAVQDLTLLTWNEGAGNYLLQSEHGFLVDSDRDGDVCTWSYAYPGECESLTIHFSGREDYFLTVYDSNQNSYYYYGDSSELTIPGNYFKLQMNLYNSYGSRYYGFAVESVTPNGVTASRPGYAAAFSKWGEGDREVMDQILKDKSLSAVFIGPSGQTATAAAALYDADGKYMGITTQEIKLTPDGQRVDLAFTDVTGAERVKLFLLDSDWTPLAADRSFPG